MISHAESSGEPDQDIEERLQQVEAWLEKCNREQRTDYCIWKADFFEPEELGATELPVFNFEELTDIAPIGEKKDDKDVRTISTDTSSEGSKSEPSEPEQTEIDEQINFIC